MKAEHRIKRGRRRETIFDATKEMKNIESEKVTNKNKKDTHHRMVTHRTLDNVTH